MTSKFDSFESYGLAIEASIRTLFPWNPPEGMGEDLIEACLRTTGRTAEQAEVWGDDVEDVVGAAFYSFITGTLNLQIMQQTMRDDDIRFEAYRATIAEAERLAAEAAAEAAEAERLAAEEAANNPQP